MTKFHIFHRYLRIKGIYDFGFKSILKLAITAAIIAVIIIVVNIYFKDFEENILYLLRRLNPAFVFSLFFVSESLLGLIPPDFFIVWGERYNHPWLILTLLACISYIGGLVSYKIGFWIQNMPRIHTYLHKKFELQLLQIKRYGAFLIIFAALFPLPYSVACMAAGMVNYPFKKLLWLGIFRFVRFAAYAVVLFKVF